MGQNSKIEWTDHTFNPWIGCIKVSPGCKNCYAETLMTRKDRWANTWGPAETTERLRTSEAKWKEPVKWNRQSWEQCRECGWRGPADPAGVHDFCPECENEVLNPARQRVFCASLADVFEDNDQLIDWRLDLFRLIGQTPNLDWLILTKRPEIARHFFRLRPDLLFDNIWLGTSVEDQKRAEERIPELLKIPARIRFLSCEPLLGPVDLCSCGHNKLPGTLGHVPRACWLKGISWVIAGGESGLHARPMNPQWARDLRDQCLAAGMSYFFKQWGEYIPYECQPGYLWRSQHGDEWCQDEGTFTDKGITLLHNKIGFARVGKHAAGRLLDGQEWSQFPETVAQPA